MNILGLMNKKIRLYLMFIILIIAGMVHLISPEKFLPAIPPVFTFPFLIIYLTGIFEMVLAILLIQKNLQDVSSKILALYFLLLIPIHVYVAYNGIEIFGVSSKFLLWLRTIFQFVFFFWAISLQTKSWVIEQVWKHVVFLHYKIKPEELQALVPFELDLFEGSAVLSVVPFYMDGIRFPFLPAIPKISSLWELNIRTYVTVNGVKGIYFFSLETDSKISEMIARNFFHLPYNYSKINANVSSPKYLFHHVRENYSFNLEATIGDLIPINKFEEWATERYSLFTKKNGKVFRGIVEHVPWTLKNISIRQIDNDFTKMVLPNVDNFISAGYSQELKVRFKNFTEIN